MNKIINKNKIILLITATAIAGFSVFYATAGIFKTNTQVVNDLKSGLVGYWTFDGQDTNWGTGIVSDKSANGNNGQVNNMATSTSPMVGKIGQALYFDGNNDSVLVSTPITLTSSYSISIWFKSAGNSSTAMIFERQSPPSSSPSLEGTDSNGYDFYVNNYRYISTGAVTVGRWYHWVGTWDESSSQLKAYLDGSLLNTKSDTTDYNIATLYLGARNGSWGYFKGSIDEFRVYNRALSANEINELYNQGAKKVTSINTNLKTDIVPSGLTGYWTFDGPDISWTGATSGTVNNRGSVGGAQTLTNMRQSNSPAIGKIGQALNFQANNQNINTGILASNLITVGEGTISVWMKPSLETRSDVSAFNLPFVVGDGYDGWYGIFVGIIGGLNRIWIYNYDDSEDRVGVEYTPDEWVHIIWKHEGGNLYAFKNGSAVGSVASGNTGGGSNFRIGHSVNYKGLLDEVRVYNRALTQIEISQLYDQGEKNLLKVNMPQTNLIPSGLVGYWPFDGQDTSWATGITNDRSGNGYNGQIYNMSTSTSPAAGISGQALKFDGQGDYVDEGDVNTFDGQSYLTMSVWVKLDSLTNYDVIIGKNYLVMNSRFGFSVDHDFYTNSIFISMANGVNSYGVVNSSILANAIGNWHLWTAVFDGTQSSNASRLKFYYDGIQQTLDFDGTSIPSSTASNSGSLNIGNINQFSPNATIDEVRIYNRALSASEIMELYRAGAGL